MVSTMQNSQVNFYSPVKPALTTEQVVLICKILYGIEPSQVVQLPGYDDQNFWIKTARKMDNNIFLSSVWSDGYVLKITNSYDSKNTDLIQAQVHVLLHLGNDSVSAPLPVANVNGVYYSLERVKGDDSTDSNYAVRLLTYVSGEVLLHAPVDLILSKNLGIFLYKLDCSLKDFKHPAFKKRNHLFMLENTPLIKNCLHLIDDENRKAIVLKTIAEFEQEVLPKLQQLEKGLIHGDFNEQNVLVNGNEVKAVLDFGDCHWAPYLFEISVGTAYLLMLTSNFEFCRTFLEGFTIEKKLTELEETLYPICVRARICQSLVLGLYAHSQNPENEYVLSSQKKGWEILNLLISGQDSLL